MKGEKALEMDDKRVEQAFQQAFERWLNTTGAEKIETIIFDRLSELEPWLHFTKDKQDIQVEFWAETAKNNDGESFAERLFWEMLDEFESNNLVDEYPDLYRHLAECFEERAADYRKQLAAMKPE